MKNLLVISVAALPFSAVAQNLVPNGSFEEYTTCPPYFGFAANATDWLNLYTQSADYFNACHTDDVVGVPLNQFGYQYPVDGNAYMGMATYVYNQSEYREMVGIQLAEPLQVGVPVCLSFKMAVGGFGTSAGNSAGYTCKGVGMKFFNTLPTEQYIYDYPNSAALFMSAVPIDTAIWYLVEGSYVPDSAYSHLVIGNFFADSLNSPTVQDSIGFGASDFAYAFIDDVRTSFELSYCTADVGITEEIHPQPIVYPLPFTNELHVRLAELPGGFTYCALYDANGRCMTQASLPHGGEEVVIRTEALSSGVYHLRLWSTNGSSSCITVIHVSP